MHLKTVRLPIPNKDDVESHLVMACAAGKMLHKTGLRMLQIECTGMKTSILGVCDRTLSMQTKRSVKVKSKVGSLLKRLIQIF
jgi:hypothetical protein